MKVIVRTALLGRSGMLLVGRDVAWPYDLPIPFSGTVTLREPDGLFGYDVDRVALQPEEEPFVTIWCETERTDDPAEWLVRHPSWRAL